MVGDVAGHGIDAVTGMVALRNCLRGLAITGAGPGALLGWLNNVACHLTDGIIGTAICGLYDPAGPSLRWARAGHMPPVLLRDGAARELSLPQGVLLGVAEDASYEEVTTSLRPGDALLLFTDGLIERRNESIDDSMESLLRMASRRSTPSRATPTTCSTTPRPIPATTHAWSPSGSADGGRGRPGAGHWARSGQPRRRVSSGRRPPGRPVGRARPDRRP